MSQTQLRTSLGRRRAGTNGSSTVRLVVLEVTDSKRNERVVLCSAVQLGLELAFARQTSRVTHTNDDRYSGLFHVISGLGLD